MDKGGDMVTNERKYKIYKKWFKLGFEHRKQNGFNPNRYQDIDTSYRLKCPYKCTFKELLSDKLETRNTDNNYSQFIKDIEQEPISEMRDIKEGWGNE